MRRNPVDSLTLLFALPSLVVSGFAAAASSANSAAGALVAEVTAIPAPLVDAARKRDAAALDQLLSAKDVDLNQRSSDGTTALHWAVYNNDESLVMRLLRAGADVNAMNDYQSSPLSEAAVFGSPAIIQALLKAGANVHAENRDGQTALMIVARTNNVEAAQLLLKRGAKINSHERWRGQSPLMWAAAEGQPEMVKLLIKNRADVNARSTVNNYERQVTAEPRMQARPAGGFTPLLFAARRGCAECARALIKAGADVNLTDPERVTPLLLATLNLSFDTAAVLLDHGADVNKWDTWGRSALYVAVDMNSLPTGGRADRPSPDKTSALEIIERLLKAGANPNLQLKLYPPYRSLRDDRGADNMLTVGTTPLLRASKAGDLTVMKLLIDHGANVDLPNVTGITPLMAAAGTGSAGLDTRGRYKSEAQALEAVKLLVAAGANISAQDRSGLTALHGAASWGWNDLVRQLVAHRADPRTKDSRGRTAADVAKGSATSSGREAARSFPETEALLRKLEAEYSGG